MGLCSLLSFELSKCLLPSRLCLMPIGLSSVFRPRPHTVPENQRPRRQQPCLFASSRLPLFVFHLSSGPKHTACRRTTVPLGSSVALNAPTEFFSILCQPLLLADRRDHASMHHATHYSPGGQRRRQLNQHASVTCTKQRSFSTQAKKQASYLRLAAAGFCPIPH